tara:strand:+ start:14466 stop:14750 length:285 start_codon:yes stop_codon:yes gene_type:complete
VSGEIISRLRAGQTPTLLSAAKANELVDAINALQNITINYGEYFNASYGSNGVVLTIPQPPEPTQTSPSNITGQEFTMYICENGQAVQKTFYTT